MRWIKYFDQIRGLLPLVCLSQGAHLHKSASWRGDASVAVRLFIDPSSLFASDNEILSMRRVNRGIGRMVLYQIMTHDTIPGSIVGGWIFR